MLKFMSSFTSVGWNFSIFDELNLSANPLDQTWTIAKVSSNTKFRPKRTQYCRIAPKVNKSIRASITSIINRYVYTISWQKKEKKLKKDVVFNFQCFIQGAREIIANSRNERKCLGNELGISPVHLLQFT